MIPYLDVDIEEEDSLAECLRRKAGEGELDLAVIRLPKISNFTDFQALALEPSVSLRYVEKAGELGAPDAILLPGTKNTIGDLLWLRESGLEAVILRQQKSGCVVFGICGGYQMLGERIEDTCGSEGGGSVRGMGLLPILTRFGEEKMRTRVEGVTGSLDGELALLSGKKVSGYEIHMGMSFCTSKNSRSFLNLGDRRGGCYRGSVLGTYVHGIFDEEDFRSAFLEYLSKKKGVFLKNKSSFDYKSYLESQYDKLADGLRASLDMEEIYQIMNKGAGYGR